VAVVNGSRAALADIRAAFGNLLVVSVTCRPEVLASRLAARGRETSEEQERRVARGSLLFGKDADTVEVDNSGDIAASGEALVALIRRAGKAPARDREASVGG
jgi:ribose 1,5-bisphosphokinase